MAAARRVVDDPAFAGEGQTVVASDAEKVLDDDLLPLRDHRPEVEVGGRRADAQGPIALGHPVAHRGEDRPLDQDARRRRAGLPGVLDAGIDEEGQGRVEVGIGEDDLRALAAELEHALDGVPRRRLLHQGADLVAAGERDEVDAGVRRERRAGFLAEAGDDVERAVGQPRCRRQLGEAQRRQAGVLGRREHCRVAHGERWRVGAADHLRRVVPRDDVGGDAERLAQQRDVVVVQERDDLAVQLVGGRAVELEIACQHDDVVARRRHRLARVARLDACQLVGVVKHLLADLHEHAAALGGRHAPPGAAVERRARRADGEIDLVRRAARDAVVGFTVGGCDHRQRALVPRGRPAAADEHLPHDPTAPRRDAVTVGSAPPPGNWNVGKGALPRLQGGATD